MDQFFKMLPFWFNEGYIDHLMPMHYHLTSNDQFMEMLENDCPNCWKLFISTGINSNRIYTVGPEDHMF